MKQKKKYDKTVYKSFVFISQFGFNMLVPIGLMTWLGIYLDKKYNTSYWVIILFFVGAVAGGRNVYQMARSVYGGQKKSNNRSEKLKKDDKKIKKG